MTSPKQIAANRTNAAKSTGPRSQSGKARASLNALVHGVRSESVILPGEDERDLSALREALHQRLLPQDPLQDEWYELIVDGFWRLRRCRRADGAVLWGKIMMRRQLQALSDPDGSQAALPDGLDSESLDLGLAFESAANSLERLNRYETSIIRRIERATRELKRLQSKESGNAINRDNIIDLESVPSGEGAATG